MDNYWTIKPTVLIIAPTRELCTQIAREAAKFVFNTDIKIANIYGGSNIRVQRKHACQAHIVSCTVGRLKVNFFLSKFVRRMSLGYPLTAIQGFIDSDKDDIDLSGVEHFILDEGDRLLDMGFCPDVKAIFEAVNKARNRINFELTTTLT